MNELSSKTVKELRDIAKGYGITGRWDMCKAELIQAISSVQGFNDSEITFESDCIIKDDETINPEGSQKVTLTTNEYLKMAKPGTLVAFKRKSNKNLAMSGKFISFDGNKAIIESKKGTKFEVKPENVIWVKTGARWPKWVFSHFNKIKEVKDAHAVS